MLDTSLAEAYADQRQTVYRVERPTKSISDAINDPRISALAAALWIWMLDRPVKWRFMVSHISTIRNDDGRLRFGGRDKVRGLLRELIAVGRVNIEREGREGGGVEFGIYTVTDYADHAESKGPCFTSPCIKSNIDNINTTSSDCGKSPQSCQPTEAEQPQAAARISLTNQAEPRNGAATCLPKAERGQARARGSAMKGGANSVRNIERLRERLVAAGGEALADPRRTPGLWRMAEITVWLMAGYSVEVDILPSIRDVAGRYGIEPGQIKSWRYFSNAIREAHARRTGESLSREDYSDPYRDPYAKQASGGDTWGQIGIAAFIGGAMR